MSLFGNICFSLGFFIDFSSVCEAVPGLPKFSLTFFPIILPKFLLKDKNYVRSQRFEF